MKNFPFNQITSSSHGGAHLFSIQLLRPPAISFKVSNPLSEAGKAFFPCLITPLRSFFSWTGTHEGGAWDEEQIEAFCQRLTFWEQWGPAVLLIVAIVAVGIVEGFFSA